MAHREDPRGRAGDAPFPAAPRFGVLGPLRVLGGGRPLDLGPRRQQIVLAALLCAANTPVSVDTLVDALWPGDPPRTARKNVQVYVSTLRGLLAREDGRGEPLISHGMAGYMMRLAPGELDWLSFDRRARSVHEPQRADAPVAVLRTLDEALALWRGPILAGLRGVPLLDEAVRRFERRYLAVFEDWAEAAVAAFASAEAVERITEVAYQYPCRERLRTAQMAALCQLGRRSEALAVYDELRRALAHDYGLAPSEAIAAFYRSILRDEGGPGTPRAAAAAASRRPAPSLPRDLPSFTGREAATRRIVDALTVDGERLVTIAGPVGAGKTALAVHAGHRLAADFPDGGFLVRLRTADGTPRAADDVLAELMWAVAPPGWSGPAAEARKLWLRWAADHRALIIVDGVRDEAEVRAFLPEVGPSAAIVTSRRCLAGLGPAYRARIETFETEEALELLGRVIGAGRVAADRAAAERVARVAGLLPLGVALAADRLAWLRHMPLREYATRMESSARLLDELSAGDGAIRPRLADATAELAGAARAVVPVLGTLGCCFTLEEAAAAMAVDEAEAARLLETLLDASILMAPDAEVVAHSVVYEMPALMHHFVREAVAAAEPSARLDIPLAC